MDSVRVVHDSIRGLKGIAAFAPKMIDSLKIEGWLGEQAHPFLVLSGYEPDGGDYSGPVLHVLRPGEEIRWTGDMTPRPEYPGQVRNMKEFLIAQSRAFVGMCSGPSRSLVEVIRYRPDGKTPWRDSVHVYTAAADTLHGTGNAPGVLLADVLQRVAKGACREITPKNHHTPADGDDP